MPIYEYRCERGHLFEQMRRFSDPPLEACVECGASVQKVLHPVAIHFKGSGFHNTDYGKGKAKAESNGGEAKSSDGAGKSDSGSSSDAKPSSTSSSSSDSSSTSSGSSSGSSSSD